MKKRAGRELEGVQCRFSEWRRNRKVRERIPEQLWEAAVSLTREIPVSGVSRALGVDYYQLKERAERAERATYPGETACERFVELKVEEGTGSCVVEMEGIWGKRIKIGLQQARVEEVLHWAERIWRG